MATNSGLFNVSLKEGLRGLVVAVTGAVIGTVYTALQSGQNILELDWKYVLSFAISAGLGYLIQKFFRNSNDELLIKDK